MFVLIKQLKCFHFTFTLSTLLNPLKPYQILQFHLKPLGAGYRREQFLKEIPVKKSKFTPKVTVSELLFLVIMTTVRGEN